MREFFSMTSRLTADLSALAQMMPMQRPSLSEGH